MNSALGGGPADGNEMDPIGPRFLGRAAGYIVIALRLAPRFDANTRLALNKIYLACTGREEIAEFRDFLGYVVEDWDRREDPKLAIELDLDRGEIERLAAIFGEEKAFEAIAKFLCSDSGAKPTEAVVSPGHTTRGEME
jgi:hypothetical protein